MDEESLMGKDVHFVFRMGETRGFAGHFTLFKRGCQRETKITTDFHAD
jgi:hypothetical protein